MDVQRYNDRLMSVKLVRQQEMKDDFTEDLESLITSVPLSERINSERLEQM